jgi:pimeloyl-ACP methyl ester carboxylesterase
VPAAFVHGNPETPAIWGLLFGELDRDDLIALSPPGFGAPVPDGWTASRAEYLAWLVGELEALDAPVDLVGHDWGGGHVMAVAMTRPDLIRSWCIDVAGIFHPGYVWHDLAQVWQTPGDGEAAIEAMLSPPPAERAAAWEARGLPPDVAADLSAATDETMGRCILALYRDAAQPAMVEAAAELPAAAARPGLVLIAADDPYVGTEAMARASAGLAGAAVTVLDGVGHWWMLQDPAKGARALEAFWSGN